MLSRALEFEEYVDDTFVRPLETIDWELNRLPRGE